MTTTCIQSVAHRAVETHRLTVTIGRVWRVVVVVRVRVCHGVRIAIRVHLRLRRGRNRVAHDNLRERRRLERARRRRRDDRERLRERLGRHYRARGVRGRSLQQSLVSVHCAWNRV